MITIDPLTDSAETRMVRDSARALLAVEWPVQEAVAMAKSPDAMRRMWKLAAAQGWTSLGPDTDGLGLPAALVLLQELGRASCPIPLLDAVLANAVLASDGSATASKLLDRLQSGEAAVSWAFGPTDDDASTFELTVDASEQGRLYGRIPFVENAAVATHLLVVTGRPNELLAVPVDSAGVDVQFTPGLNVPALAEVRFDAVEAFATLDARFDLAMLAPLARLMLAARSLGAAQRGLEMLTEYAGVRTQFGKKIGQYQAIQHKLANCLIAIEVCRLSVLRAGCASGSSAQRIYAAAVASANAGQAMRQVAMEIHHGFGGVSFWEEHEMPRHFRRIHGDLTRLGGVHAARRDIADALIGTNRLSARIPDLDLGERANAFRREVRAWLDENWDHHYPPETFDLPVNHRKAQQAFSRKLGEKGWLGITWPRQFGGQERSALEHLVFEEEMAYAEAPVTFHNTAANMIAPTLIAFGSAEQKDRFLPGIAKGEISFALGYSEPDHGSDLAGIRTMATRGTQGWVVNGQKIYTSTAGFSTHVWLAARTNQAEPRHRGISVFIVPLDSPGITIQPMIGLNGHRSNIVFYDDVRLAPDALVGEENGGWEVITAALAFERVALAGIAARARAYFDQLLERVRNTERGGPPLASDSLVRDRIGQLAAEIEGARLLAVHTAQRIEEGEIPVWQAAMAKVYASELMERLAESAFDLLGTGATIEDGAPSSLVNGRFEYAVRDALLYTIGGGTNEIQRSLIASRGLGMPR